MVESSLGNRLKELRKGRGLTKAEAATKIGIKYGTFQRYEYGGRPSSRNIDKIVSYYGCSKAWLLTGEGEPFPGSREAYVSASEERPDKGYVVLNEEAEKSQFVYVPQLDGRISAGNGAPPQEAVKTQLAFRKDWLLRKGNPANMALIKISGDSMEPLLYDGDLVLIDRSRNYLAPEGGIYAIALDDAIMIKRLLADATRKIRIISDNRNYPEIPADADQVKINGKVIWFGRELER